VNNKIEKNIFKFLDITYGDTKLFETDTCYFISGICIYYKSSKQVGWTGLTHLDLVRTFGEGRYYPQLNKWFSEKYNLEVIKTPIFN
jgi:hypothetical protein